ncbi:MAG: hypothetical protein LBS07_05350 [Prevotellaceae bacterium]|jgi:hypothetical protein|nr:hypothetical protein [Prevotellaceae bacterium]
MEQKDYILREIEKIGLLLTAIRQKLFGGKENLSISLEKQIESAKGMLLKEINFDFDHFLSLNPQDSINYINNITGFSIENIELLAGWLSRTGFSYKSENSTLYLEKALQLYEYCSLKSKTYSLDREVNMEKIKNVL